jgi:phosphatidylserine/phosphatidylglycerophosphate/cardiolipin synthase-like enzyme
MADAGFLEDLNEVDFSMECWIRLPTPQEQDLAQARDLIAKAEEGILFLFFNPGAYQTMATKFTLLQDVLERHNPQSDDYNAGLYIRGVVNQEIKGLTEPGAPPADDKGGAAKSPVVVISGGAEPEEAMSSDVLVPAAIKAKYHDWQSEVLSLGVMVHSKVVVLDPFGTNPVVMTGSHNLGTKASEKNDDNLIIVQGNAALAQAYALNIIAIYQEYRWRHYVQQQGGKPQAWSGLQDNDQWQQGYLTRGVEELDFWMGGPAKSP